MIYIRNIFKQDLRDGKQIAFPKEASNVFFSFNYSTPDPDRQISFKYKITDNQSRHSLLEDELINTRLYAAGSESRIDGQLKQFLRDKLNAKIDDILVVKKLNDQKYTFDLIQSGSAQYDGYKKILGGKNHEVILTDPLLSNNDSNLGDVQNFKSQFADWFIALDGAKHNYFTDAFGSNRDRLIEHLGKYEEVYSSQFNTAVFTVSLAESEEFIRTLEKNIYTDKGAFFDFSLRTSTHMPRAILGKKNYIAFLKEFFSKPQFDSDPFSLELFQQSLIESNLKFEKTFSTRLIASLLTKPFVILTGLTGSGKTKLAQSFAYWLSGTADQYEIVPVGADWTNREPLLGYPDGLNSEMYIHPDSKVLELILRAEESDLPHFLILDEMNLSHVERYFADFLSIMESGETAKLYSGANRKDSHGKDVPQQISWPKNLYIIGTVNIDESTYMFSPKVLDRANVIEFRITELEMETFLKSDSIIDMSKLRSKGAEMGIDFVARSMNKANRSLEQETQNELLKFFRELKKLSAEFGYRSASEISTLLFNLGEIDSSLSTEDKLDIAIMQKMLPKLHGSRSKLLPILERLGKICLKDTSKWDEYLKKRDEVDFSKETGIIYKLSFEKIVRMYSNALDNGFASYAEA